MAAFCDSYKSHAFTVAYTDGGWIVLCVGITYGGIIFDRKIDHKLPQQLCNTIVLCGQHKEKRFSLQKLWEKAHPF
jgi:hypothetical protein